jgi:hypothetical protein
MKAICTQTVFALFLIVGVFAMTLGAALPSASSTGHKRLHLTKNCLGYTGQTGSSCTISSSNLRAIPVGSKVFYFQSLIPSTGLLDSNIVLDAGSGNRAVGRCTLDLVDKPRVVHLLGRTGDFSGFHARVSGSGSFAEYHWDGTYGFDKQPGERDDD